MKPIRYVWPAAIAITLALATPGFAQARHESRGNDGNNREHAVARGQERPAAAAPQEHAGPRAAPVPRAEVHDSRGYAVPRADVAPRAYVAPRTYVVAPRAYNYYRPYAGVPVVRYARPYYAFRPRFVVGLGIYAGYPIPYPMAYGYPAYAYGYPYGNSAYVQGPPPGTYGGMSFDIAPDDAAVWVDGQYVGVARDFSPLYQPLTLTPGRHRIELQAPSTAPLVFDVDITPGRVLPYRGTLQPY